MGAIEPGEKFRVAFGSGKSIEVTALNLRKKRELIKLVEVVSKGGGGVQVFDAIESALRMVAPEISESVIDTLDESMAMTIVTGAMGLQAISEADEKKSESPHSSGAASFANHVHTYAET